MKTPLSFLKEFIEIKEDTSLFLEKMIMSGSNVDEVKDYKEGIENVVLGRVLDVKPHNDSDHLVIVKLDVNSGSELQIVTGADNVHIGAIVPVALNPSKLPGGVKIKETIMRGVKSTGMICSSLELGFSNSVTTPSEKNGIWEIENEESKVDNKLFSQDELKIGENIISKNLLDDVAVDFEITPNRPDCLSIFGLSKEVKATFDRPLKVDENAYVFDDSKLSESKIKIEANTDKLFRYTFREISDIKVKPSPFFIRKRLMMSGIRPINNIVDITNYVMLEVGNPIHAFDKLLIEGEKIVIRTLDKEEEFTTLDEEKRTLPKDTLTINDGKKIVAVAGVMGGLNSSITSETKSVIIESACFDPDSIRKTSKNLGLRTEASGRYEKGISPVFCELALNRVCELIEKTGSGKVSTKISDAYNVKQEKVLIPLRFKKVNEILGTKLSSEEIVKILDRLEIKNNENKNSNDLEKCEFEIPFFRLDLKTEIDLIEEVGRIYGFDNIPLTLPKTIVDVKTPPLLKIESHIKDCLISFGFNEINTYSFQDKKDFDKTLSKNESEIIKILNPLGEETSSLRNTLIPNMINALNYNLSKMSANELKLFEVGNVFRLKDSKTTNDLNDYIENKELIISLVDKTKDFYHLKSVLNETLKFLGITDLIYEKNKENETFHKGKCADIIVKKDHLKNVAIKNKQFDKVKENKFEDISIGIIGALSPKVLKNFDIDEKKYKEVLISTIDLNKLLDLVDLKKEYRKINKFPDVTRDLSIVVKKDVIVKDIIEAIKSAASKILEECSLVDLYEGEKIKEGYRSLSFRQVYRKMDKTLTDEEVNEVEKKILNRLNNDFNASLRNF